MRRRRLELVDRRFVRTDRDNDVHTALDAELIADGEPRCVLALDVRGLTQVERDRRPLRLEVGRAEGGRASAGQLRVSRSDCDRSFAVADNSIASPPLPLTSLPLPLTSALLPL